MIEALEILVCGLAAGALGGLLGIGGGIVLIPFLRFYVGLSPVYAAGTCVLAVFCTTLSGSYRHHKLGQAGALGPAFM
ncbi:MAG: TSUP family transporter, partial [Phycisphaerae bacterium]|nr:TSUP family transporter [Phycisphaerae bacterium]